MILLRWSKKISYKRSLSYSHHYQDESEPFLYLLTWLQCIKLFLKFCHVFIEIFLFLNLWVLPSKSFKINVRNFGILAVQLIKLTHWIRNWVSTVLIRKHESFSCLLSMNFITFVSIAQCKLLSSIDSYMNKCKSSLTL